MRIVLQFSLIYCSSEGLEFADLDNNVFDPNPCDQLPESNLWERLGRVSMMDIESSSFKWTSLTSLHHTKHTSTSTESTEDDNNRSFEVTVNSGGVVFIALFRTLENSDSPSKEAAAVIKIAPSRMATQSERFGYELAKWLGVRTPQGRVIHNSSSEWQKIKDAVENARHMAVATADELEELICTEMLEALELSRCLFLMNYVHGSPLLENAIPFDSRKSAEKTAEALGRVLILDLVLRNEDRLRCRHLGWRGNYANLLVVDKEAHANLDSLDDVCDSAIIRYKPEIIRSPQNQKQRRAASISVYQKLDGLLKIFFNLMYRSSNESDKEDAAPSDSPLCSVDTQIDSNDTDIPRHLRRPSRTLSRESLDPSSPNCRETFFAKSFKGNGDGSRGLRLTMKLRDFNKYAKLDSELSKEMEQWNEMLRTDVVKLCQDNNFNTGFFEGTDNSIAVDAYELKVRLEHILERISLISEAASTERPSQITDYLYIGGALAARSTHTLQHLGITHILCLCANEIGQSESQKPFLFDYRNFFIKDDENADICDVFQDASDFIDYVKHLRGKVLVHCFEGKSRSATVVLAYLIVRKNCTLLEAWNMLKKVHRRAHPNDGFAKVLLDLDKKLHGKVSMEWQHRRPAMKVCPICGKNAGLSSSSLKLHLQKAHRKISSGSVDSAMTMEIQKAIEVIKASRGGGDSPTQKSQSHIEGF
ncbi:hypothetical protein PR202_ga22926 [Eleusine coracana subsp. coracana]|uniref:Uncharacterized protein n=1 Tax=Eleusine coracana subsp. coracana TaxID=191504 RepID=A0AAV5D5A7_ELECO|nr:hypothetical protein PR202_ga22926 [Eleusine coracana subsp. coracana]